MTDRPGRSRPLLGAVLGLALLVLLKTTAALVMPIAGALLLALLLSTTTEALQRRGVPAALAAALAAFVPAAALATLALAAWSSAAGWWHDLQGAFARLAGSLEPFAAGDGATGAALRWLLARDWGAGGAGLAGEAGTWALQTVSVLMLTFFLLWGQRSLVAGVLRSAPDPRARIRRLGALRDARRGAASYLATMGWINLGLAVATGLGITALGVAHGPAWIGVVFVLLFVPYLGPAAIALLLAAAAPGPTPAGIAAPPLLFLLLHAIEAQFVSPWLMGRRLRVGRPALLLSVMAGGWAWGVVGGVLAVPLLIAGHALVVRRPGAATWKALLAGEAPAAAGLADSAARVLENRRRGAPGVVAPLRARRLPRAADDSSAACASPTSPKPIPPKSTASH